jgi:hypothetical protein
MVKMILFMGIGMMVLSGCATAPLNVYKGSLVSGRTQAGALNSNEIWLLHGEKGSRVVISDAVADGKIPPKIYLYPPESSKYEVRSYEVSDRSQVLDYELESSGDYVVLVHQSEPQNVSNYKIAFTALTQDGPYTIEPDDPDGNLIKDETLKDSKSKQLFISRSGGLVPVVILFDLVTFGYGPYFFTAFSGADKVVGDAIELHNRIETVTRNIENPVDHSNIMFAMTKPR